MMNNIMKKHMRKQSGFTLVEIAIAMVIVGFILAFATVAFSRVLVINAEKNTFKNMEYIADSISVYAQKHMRVPCPADPAGLSGTTTNGEPFGTEINSTASGDIFGECDINEAEGIIPFATLGLPKYMAKDKFGNYITYRVSIASSQKPEVAETLDINNWCMTRPYWNTDNDGIDVTDEYVALAKAAFCCGTWNAGGTTGVEGDIDLQGSFGPLEHLSRSNPNGGAGGSAIEYRDATEDPPAYADLEDPGITGFIAGNDSTVPPSFPAFILISHGQNGNGAFSEENGSRDITGITDPERENVDSDITFYAPDRLASAPPGGGLPSLFSNDIDDIVLWATPSQVLGRIGGVSCNAP